MPEIHRSGAGYCESQNRTAQGCAVPEGVRRQNQNRRPPRRSAAQLESREREIAPRAEIAAIGSSHELKAELDVS